MPQPDGPRKLLHVHHSVLLRLIGRQRRHHGDHTLPLAMHWSGLAQGALGLRSAENQYLESLFVSTYSCS